MKGNYLYPADVKEHLSLAYAYAVASRAGYSLDNIRVDRDGVDFRVIGRHAHDTDYPVCDPTLAVQMKATTKACLRDDHVAYPLIVPNYNDLKKRVGNPRFLVVFVMPSDDSLWLHQDEERMLSRGCAYYLSLSGMPDTPNSETITVKIPRSNRFDVSWLGEAMEKASWGAIK